MSVIPSASQRVTITSPFGNYRRFALVLMGGLVLLWSAALFQKDGDHATGKSVESSNRNQQEVLVDGFALVIATTPELEQTLSGCCVAFQKENRSARYRLRTYPDVQCFNQMADGTIHGVLSSRVIRPEEARAMAKTNRDFVQIAVPWTEHRQNRGKATKQTEGEFLYLYVRRDSVNGRPSVSRFVQRFKRYALQG